MVSFPNLCEEDNRDSRLLSKDLCKLLFTIFAA